jgi:farnesyl diphosphate synthase
MAQKTTLKEFEAVYPKLEEAILDHARSYKLPEKELQWFKEVSTKTGQCLKSRCGIGPSDL